MKRKIYEELLLWKSESAPETALLIEGARRVGKSWIVEEFAKREYRSYILIDFNKVSKSILDIFNNYLEDLDVALVNNLDVKNEIIYNRICRKIGQRVFHNFKKF